MRKFAAGIWQTVHFERRRLAADLSGLRDEQWRVSSLCPGWDIHDVLAHLVDTARTGRLSCVRDLLIARMDFDRAKRERRCPREAAGSAGNNRRVTGSRSPSADTAGEPRNTSGRGHRARRGYSPASGHCRMLPGACRYPGPGLPTAHPCLFRRRTRACRRTAADRPEDRRGLGEGRRGRGRLHRPAAGSLRATGGPGKP
jgi:hypothetical protein